MSLIWVVPAIITQFILYKKAGKPGWAAIIPFYGTYVMGQIAGKPNLALVLIGLFATLFIPYINLFVAPLALMILSVLILIEFIQKYNGSALFWVCYMLFPPAAVFMVKSIAFKGGAVQAPATGQMAESPLASPVQPMQNPIQQAAPQQRQPDSGRQPPISPVA